MPKEDNKILKYNRREKSMKVSFIIYADIDFLLKNINTCPNNSKKSWTTKINQHTASGYLLFTNCLFDTAKNKLDFYGGKDCMKNFCNDLREHATKIINYKKKETIPLTNEKKKLHRKQNVCYICKKRFSADDKNKKYQKVRHHWHYTEKHRGAAHDICNLRYKTPK